MDQLGGTLTISQGKSGGTTIEATVPLSHMLPPEDSEHSQVAAE
jgi:two-component system NarL family sensor kinase